MLELDDIQHFLLTRPRALAARYGFISVRRPDHGRAWLSGIIDRVGRGRAVESGGVLDSGGALDSRWVTVAFTWNGLRALGVDDACLATFPEEFRQGMAHRATILGDTGANHPDHWVDGTASPDGIFCAAQPNPGAFAVDATRLVIARGTPVTGGLDTTAKDTVLASAFCIPRTGNLLIDGAADLPGPGMTSLGGTVQLQ